MQEKIITSLPLNESTQEKEINAIQKLQNKINSLKLENTRLRKQVKHLKYRLRHSAQMRKTSKSYKQNDKKKRQQLKALVNEQNLHPVSKAMINLQLHTPNAVYTEEEKNVARQLYYYSASAFCCLRKANYEKMVGRI